MKGDFTRNTFRPERRFSSVRMQQGRVQMDADWNEAEDIRLGRERIEIRDIVGGCGAPIDNAGFGITFSGGFKIGAGRLYDWGILTENPAEVDFTAQADFPGAALPSGSALLFYLDVWEEHVTALEDSLLREVALNGPDTATRSRVVWQVKAAALPDGVRTCAAGMATLPGDTDAVLEARAKTLDDTEACTVKPGSSYKRLENQLYRVEVHESGSATTAKLKWSRDNGSIASTFTIVDGRTLAVDQIGRDAVLSFQAGGYIEVTDRKRELLAQPGTFFRVSKVEGNRLILDPGGPAIAAADYGDGMKARRWDSAGPILFANPDADGFMMLEDGVAIKLSGNDLRSGDYWLIPARTVTGDVEWPFTTPQPPRGIVHRRCPLAIAVSNDGWTITDCRNPFTPLADMIGLFYVGGDGQIATHDPNGSLVLPMAPTVGVARGKHPVPGAIVRWTVVQGSGTISGPADRPTDANGLVSCPWTLDSITDVQQLRADLLDSEGNPIHIPIVFTATLPKPTGGTIGCCRSIGEGGDYPTILEAIMDLVFKQKIVGICLCLMPGAHQWPDKVEGEPPANLSLTITGLRDASVLVARDTLQLGNIKHFVLSDLRAALEAGLRIDNVDFVDFEHVTFVVRETFGLEAVTECRIRDCMVDADTALIFEDVQWLTIDGTEARIVADGHAIEMQGGQRLDIENSSLVGMTTADFGATLAIQGTRLINILGNQISGRRKATPPPTTTTGPAVGAVNPGVTPVAGAAGTTMTVAGAPAAAALATQPAGPATIVGNLIKRLGTELNPADLKREAVKLLGANAEERTANAAAVAAAATDTSTIGQDGAARLNALNTVLRDPNADQAKIADAIGNVSIAVLNPKLDTGALAATEAFGYALNLNDGRAFCNIGNNTFIGYIALYGDPATNRITPDLGKRLQARLKQSSGTWGTGNLHFSNNTLLSIVLSGSFVDGEGFKELLEKGSVSYPVFRTATVSDNTFLISPLEMLFSTVTVTGNVFPAIGDILGYVIARQATYTGNVTPGNTAIMSVTAAQAEAANLGLNIM